MDQSLFDTGKPIAIRTAAQASQRARDRLKVATGTNRLRMRRRIAQRYGLSLEEYERRRRDDQARRNEELYERAERWAKRCDRTDEDKRTAHSKNMLAKYWADPDNWSTRKKRRRIFERDGWRCRACGKTVSDNVPATANNRAVAGHILAKATGGKWTDENMCTLCYPCNVKDGVNRLPIQMTLL